MTTIDIQKLIRAHVAKIVVNTGIGRLSQTANFSDKVLPEVTKDFSAITGQKPTERAARISISGFKIREGAIIGLKATLRGQRMADFLAKLINIVLPRVRDFRGIDMKAVDAGGNLTIGVKEHIVFPEMEGDLVKTNFGLEMTIVPKSIRRDAAIEFYKKIGILFKRSEK